MLRRLFLSVLLTVPVFAEGTAIRIPALLSAYMVSDAQSRLYINDSSSIRRYDPSGATTLIAGGGNGEFGASGVSATSVPIRASAMTLDGSGNLFFVEDYRVRKVNLSTGMITTVAGNGSSFGDGGPATSAQLNFPKGITTDTAGNLYIAENQGNRIRRVDASNGKITTAAGDGFAGGPNSILQPDDVAVAPNGDIYIASQQAHRVWRFSNGRLTPFAGNGSDSQSGDGGLAVSARLCGPSDVELDDRGNVFIGDDDCGTVRRVDISTGIIESVAGGGKGIQGTQGSPFDLLLRTTWINVYGNTLYVSTQAGEIWKITDPSPRSVNPPKISDLVHAATFGSTYPIPGALMTIFGDYLGPAAPMTLELDANGYVKKELSGVRITFNGTPAPLTYLSAGQVNLVVPFSVTRPVTMRVETPSGTAEQNYTNLSNIPNIGFFPGAIVNPDGGINGPDNPAPRGATLVLYGTGMGPTVVRLEDGSVPTVAVSTARVPQAGRAGQVLYVGQAPFLVAGVVQTNIRMSDSLPDGPIMMALENSPANAYVPVYVGLNAPVPVIADASIDSNTGSRRTVRFTGTNILRISADGVYPGVAELYFQGERVGTAEISLFGPDDDPTADATFDFGFNSGVYELQVVHPFGKRSNRMPFTVTWNDTLE